MTTLTSEQEKNLQDISDVRHFFEPMSNADTLRFCLGLSKGQFPDAPALAGRTIVVCIDTEGWDASSIAIKEIGINTFDSKDMAQISSPGPWGENLMNHIYFYFARIQKNAHLINKNSSAGDPNTNRFGTQRFLSDSEVIHFLKDIFEWPLSDKNDDCVCPIVLLGHALDNDVGKIDKVLSFNAHKRGNLVKEIDTQVIARDTGHWKHPVNQIGLQRLVNEMGFEYKNAHTASNDAAMTTISAIQLVLESSQKTNLHSKTLQDIVDQTAVNSKSHEWSHGSGLFCLRCGGRNHFQDQAIGGGRCRERVYCKHCAADRPGREWGHRGAACVMKAFETSNSSRPNLKKRNRS